MDRLRILALWSAPRCRSTAFLRMMIERGDFTVLNEPFSNLAGFGSSLVDGVEINSEPALIDALRRSARRKPVFFKDTTDESYPGVLADHDFLANACHTFLIREPRWTVPSYYQLDKHVTRHQIGFDTLHSIFTAVIRGAGRVPVVIDADDLVSRPRQIVRRYCELTGIPFIERALHWSPGSRVEWQRTERWHREVSDSGGFEQRSRPNPDIVDKPHLQHFVDFHTPFYQRLRTHRIIVPVDDR